jgi:ATP-dependent RNA helicase RhlE
LALALPASALAKSYEISSLKIEAALNEAGDMQVVETRTFDFSGSFSWVEWDLETSGSNGIKVSAVSFLGGGQKQPYEQADPSETPAPFTYSVEDRGGVVVVKAGVAAADQQWPMQLEYTVDGAVQRYTDAAELYWQFVGEGWPVPTRDLAIRIAPPEPLAKSDVKAWAHGPLEGVVAIQEDGVVTLEAPAVPANTFVEGRVLYPPEAFPGAKSVEQPRREEVMAEEAALANEANSQRIMARIWIGLGVGGAWLLALAGLGLAIWALVRYGREYTPQFQGEYFREDPRPDLDPAVIGALWRMGAVKDEDISATLMNLADKGAIVLQPIEGQRGFFGKSEKDYLLSVVPEKAASMSSLETELVDVLIGTPGRLIDYFKQHVYSLKKTRYLIIDEADRMFDMGFLPDIRRILQHVPSRRQTLFFSATMPDDIHILADKILKDPVTVQIGMIAPAETVSHALYPVPDSHKARLLFHLLEQTATGRVLIFTRTKHRARNLAQDLEARNYRVAALQGNMTQNRRQEAISGFRAGKYDVLVATDIAARGIDVSEISHVINYDMPDTVDAYTHRIGRTGRATLTGEAFTFASPADEWLVRDIERLLGERIERRKLESFDYGSATADRGPAQQGRTYGNQPQRSRQPSRGYGQGKSGERSGDRPYAQANGHSQATGYGQPAARAAHVGSSSNDALGQSEQLSSRPNNAPARQPQRRRRFVNQGRSSS